MRIKTAISKKCAAVFLGLMLLLGNWLNAQNPTIDPPRKWATTIGGSNFDFVTDAVDDGQGGVYVTGYTNSTNFPTTLPGSPGLGYDVLVAQIDSLGAIVWSTRFGGSGADYGNAIAKDALGNLLIAGKLGGQGTFVTDSTYKGTGDDILVLKLTSAGSLIAATRYGGSALDEAVGICATANNQIVVVGNSSSTNIPTTSSTYDGTSGDAFVLRLRSNLSRHWAFRYGGNSFEKANDVVADAQGNIYVAGETGSANFQQTIATYQGSGGAKAFVMRFDSLGTRAWAQRYGGSGVERAYALQLSMANNLLVVGYTTSANFPTTIAGLNGAGLDAFLLEMDLNGNRNFARRLGGSLDDLALDLTTDASGNIFMFGETESSNFPATNNRFKGQGRDQFVSKFNAAGDFQWSIPFGGLQNDFTGGGLTSVGSSIYLAGHTQSANYPQTLPGTGGSSARGAILRLRDCLGQNADFGFMDVCEFDTVHFQNLSSKGSSDTVAYRWWFGDGDSSDVIQPSHYYTLAGAYQVTLKVTSPCGIDSIVTKTVNVYPAPRAGFSLENVCATRTTTLLDSTQLDTILGSFEATWAWDFGDSTGSSLQNPTTVYAQAGNYNVHFTVTSNYGCTDTISHPLTVHYRPTADFSFADICLRDTAIFTNNSTIGGDSLVAWDWSFGDSGMDTVANPAYLYSSADTFDVALIAWSDEGCSDTLVQPIKVLPLPIVNFGMTDVCWPSTVTFTDSSTLTGDMISGYWWQFGDGQTDTLQNTLHNYAASGDYPVVLWVYTASGCGDSLAQDLTVNDKPVANFGFQNVCWPESNLFSDSSSVQADSLVVWNWDFGDGNGDNIANPSHTYLLPDTFDVRLEVISGFGCSDTVVKSVIVYPKPEAYFRPIDVCYPLAANLSDSSSIVGDAFANYLWDFGDGNSANGLQVVNAYAQSGGYLVTLVVETMSGCRDTLSDSIYIFPQPLADFSIENVCDNDTVFLSDSSSVSAGTVDLHWYDFGDGNGATSADTMWIYANAGSYNVVHTVASDKGCLDTIAKMVTIHALPNPNPTVVEYADICIGDTIHLVEYQSFAQYQWENGDTNAGTQIFGRSDWVVLTVIDSNQCSNLDSVEVRYHPVPRPNAVIAPGPVVIACSNDSLVLNAGGAYASYLWSDGATSRLHYVDQSGDYSVLVFNGFGCADTSESVNVAILPAPARPQISQLGDTLVVPAASSYQWFLNSLPIPIGNTQKYLPTTTGDYFCETTDGQGCTVRSDTVSSIVSARNALVRDLTIYPNPFQSTLHFRGLLAQGGTLQIQIRNVLGQLIYEASNVVSAGLFETECVIPNLPTGYYLCELKLGKNLMYRSLIKE